MSVRSVNDDAPLQSLRNAARLTGLSIGSLRRGCIEGRIPHVRVGSEYRVNMPLLFEQLDEQSRGAIKGKEAHSCE